MKEYSEYKNSGNSIIGNIPSRWNLIKFKRICYGFNNGTSCDQISPSENTVAVSRIETISGGKLNYDKVGYILPDSKLDRYKLNKGVISPEMYLAKLYNGKLSESDYNRELKSLKDQLEAAKENPFDEEMTDNEIDLQAETGTDPANM